MRRSILLFLIALGLGALTVVGQEGESDRTLRQKIVELTGLLSQRAEARKVPSEALVITRSYSVADLVSLVRDERLVPSNLKPSKFTHPQVEEFEPWAAFEVDQLVELIRMIVEPETWDAINGAAIEPRNRHIMVTNIARVHTGVTRLLDTLRSVATEQVAIDVAAVPVGPEFTAALARSPRDLAESELKEVAKLPSLGSARLVCRNGQQVVQRSGTLRTYLADFDVEIAQAAKIGDPQQGQVFEGFAVQIRAAMDRGGGGAVLHCRIEQTDLHDPIRRVDTEHGPLELPAMQLTRLNTSLWAPFGKTVVAGGCTIGDRPCVFLLTARLLR
ncbi:MAG: hypothetical protein ACYSX0_19790 [Planctomycetota bacterium]|jgi:hypothetical protein